MAQYTLDGNEKKIEVLGIYASIKNNSDVVMYASGASGIDPAGEAVTPIQPGESVVIPANNERAVFVLGTGDAAVLSGNKEFNFFKPAPKGGGGDSGDGITQQQLNDTLKSYATNVSVDTKLEGYAEKDEIPTSLPADGGNADTLQGVGLSDGNGSKGIISIPTDNAPCEIGQFLDFHRASTSEDYTVRLEVLENGDIRMAHKSGITGGTIHCDVDTVGGYTAEQLIQSNPNLLDNPDFRINQRGQTEYTNIWEQYTCDRWKTSGNVKVLDNGGLEWTHLGSMIGAGNDHYCDIYQSRPADGVFESNMLATFSACVNGQVYSVSGKGAFAKQFTINNHAIELISYDGPTYRIRTYGEDDYTITVSWTKLELGGVATPFVPPNPATELLKCQRYFENGNADSLCTRSPSYNDWLTVHYFAVPKRVPPTITVKNVLHNDVPMDCTLATGSMQTCFWGQATDGTKFDVDDHTYCVVFEASADL